MALLDKIDDATFKVVDGSVLWLWNEWGVPFRKIAVAAYLPSLVVSLAHGSDWGKRYDLNFTLFAPMLSFLYAVMLARIVFTPPEVLSASNALFRRYAICRITRAFSLSGVLLTIYKADLRASIDAGLWLICLLLTYALVPTKPRNKKRREVRSNDLAWSRT